MPPPTWLEDFANRVAETFSAFDLLAPVGCHQYRCAESGQWEVTVFVSSTEVVGGEFDGRIVPSKFFVDIAALFALFDQVASSSWQTLPIGEDDAVGAHLSVEGVYRGHEIWLRIPAQAPPEFEPGRKASPWAGFHDEWK